MCWPWMIIDSEHKYPKIRVHPVMSAVQRFVSLMY